MGLPATFGVSASGKPPKGDKANAVLSGVIAGVGPGKPFATRGPMNLMLWESFNTALTTTAGSLAATVAAAGTIAGGEAINSALVPLGTTVGAIAGDAVTLALPILTLRGKLLANGQLTLDPAPSSAPYWGVNGFAAALLGAGVNVAANSFGVTLPAGTTVSAIIQKDVPSQAFPLSAGLPAIIQLSADPTVLPGTIGSEEVAFEFTPTANAILASGTDALAIFTGANIEYVGTVQVERSFDGGLTWLPANIGGSGQLAQYAAGTPVSITFGEPEREVLYRVNCLAFTAVAGSTLNYRISQTGGAAESLAIGPLSGG
jgi:hypothetical protein